MAKTKTLEEAQTLKTNPVDSIGFVKVSAQIIEGTPIIYEAEETGLKNAVEEMDEDAMKKFAALGFAFFRTWKQFLEDKETMMLVALSDEALEEAVKQASASKNIDEDSVEEQYVPNPNHIDPMFG